MKAKQSLIKARQEQSGVPDWKNANLYPTQLAYCLALGATDRSSLRIIP